MTGGQIALLVVVSVVVLVVAVAVIAGRGRVPKTAEDRRSRALTSTEELVESMHKIHLRIHGMVAEGRLDEARAFARALYKLTRRDPEQWVRHVAERVRADPSAPGPDFTAVRTSLRFGSPAQAIEEYRRVTGAEVYEAERVVAAMTVADGRRP